MGKGKCPFLYGKTIYGGWSNSPFLFSTGKTPGWEFLNPNVHYLSSGFTLVGALFVHNKGRFLQGVHALIKPMAKEICFRNGKLLMKYISI